MKSALCADTANSGKTQRKDSDYQIVCSSFMLTQDTIIIKEGDSSEKILPPQLTCEQACSVFSLIIWYRRTRPLWRVTLWAVDSWCYKKAEVSFENQVSKQHSSIAFAWVTASRLLPCLRSYLGFLQWWTVMKNKKLKETPFSPHWFWSWCFIIENRNPNYDKD